MDEKPWDTVDFKWDERPGPGSGEPTALDLVWNMKSWEVIADKGKETRTSGVPLPVLDR